MMSKGQFSPVNKLSSGKAMQGRNLTGPARNIRDLTADIHTNIQQWNECCKQGVTLLKEITQTKQDESYPLDLQELCDKLESICDSLDDIVRNLDQIGDRIKKTISLDNNTVKLFTTWPSSKFAQVVESIYSAYFCEAEVKRKVLEDVAHYSTDPWKMLFLATWAHQPLLPENLTILLESILHETGHK